MCSRKGCQNPVHRNSLCKEHAKLGEPDANGFRVDSQGYKVRWTVDENGKRVKEREHRFVMERMLGRKLLPGENVHHRNGNRSDNSPPNLSLWVVAQPAGQEVSDLVRYAREILMRYGNGLF